MMPSETGGLVLKSYVCDVCGWVYEGIEPGTPWEEVPDDFLCPECGVGKDEFSPVEP
jgi:rubredoxin